MESNEQVFTANEEESSLTDRTVHVAKVMRSTNVNAPSVTLFCGSRFEYLVWLEAISCG
jgi:hypothetical protein